MIRLRLVRASDDIQLCNTYVEGHRKVLEAFGVTKVTSVVADWVGDPHTYLLVAESPAENKLLGGGRIQLRTPGRPMPLEDAIAILDERIYPYVDARGDYQTAEFCGLWNSKEIAGYGVGSIILGEVGVAICPQIGVRNLMALCSPATLNNCIKVGFHIIRELGNNGTLYYPKEDLIATALIIPDIDELPGANPVALQKIKSLRDDPTQQLHVNGPKGELTIQFDLRLPESIVYESA